MLSDYQLEILFNKFDKLILKQYEINELLKKQLEIQTQILEMLNENNNKKNIFQRIFWRNK